MKFDRLLNPDIEKAASLSVAEFKRLKAEALYGRNGLRNLAIIWFSFGGALRVSEIAKLKIKDILTKDGILKVQFRLPGTYAKNGESRWAYILEKEHREAVSNYLLWRKQNSKRTSDSDDYLGLRPDSPVFLAKGNAGFTFKYVEYEKADGCIAEYIVCSSLQQLLSDLVKRVNRKGSSHSGRRSFATRLADRGIDIQFIQHFLGHKSKQQTIDYIDADPRKGRSILKTVYGEL